MTYPEQQLGDVIRKYRKERGLTQSQLSEKVEISHRQIMSIENGRCFPKFETLCRIVQVLNIPADHIFNPEVISDDRALESFIALFRSCAPEDRELVLATMQVLVDQLKRKNHELFCRG